MHRVERARPSVASMMAPMPVRVTAAAMAMRAAAAIAARP
jgi:hypothetical protein